MRRNGVIIEQSTVENIVFRLNNRAYKILKKEIERLAEEDELAEPFQKEFVLKQLNKMRLQTGKPATSVEIKEVVSVYSNFSEKVIDKAAKVNQKGELWLKTLPIAVSGVAGLAGLIWLVNLPLPMIRRPVARVAPIVLLPSYISMDRNYREAISNVEEAEQLVQRATSAADIELGDKKVKKAQKNLDALPVWFLGYEPKFYCSLLQCSWKFTFDEFEVARRKIGRMKAVVFQERNALNQINNVSIEIENAKTEYQNSTRQVDKEKAIAAWQEGIDRLEEVPKNTLAGKQSKVKLKSSKRDFEKEVGIVAGDKRTFTLIQAAQQFALQAELLGGNRGLKYYEWQQKEKLWLEAIALLKKVPLKDPGYVQAQSLLAQYQSKLARVRIEKQKEADSLAALKDSQKRINKLISKGDYGNRSSLVYEIQGVITQLEMVEPGTTSYNQAQELISNAELKLRELE